MRWVPTARTRQAGARGSSFFNALDVMAVRSHLNRAIATSVSDAVFLAETRRLAASSPDELIHGCIACAVLDVEQADLIHSLLCEVPDLVSHCANMKTAETLLISCLRSEFAEEKLSSARDDALLLFTARLTMQGASAPPLVSRDLVLDSVVTPLLESENHPRFTVKLPLLLRSALQLLSGRPELITAQQLPNAHESTEQVPMGTPSLATFLTALLQLLERRAALPAAATTELLLRATHATVQLLLPRISHGSSSSSQSSEASDAAPRLVTSPEASLSTCCRAWMQHSWQTQLHVWPLLDRIGSSGPRPKDGADPALGTPATRGNAGERLVHWLFEVAKPSIATQELCCLVIAAGVPGVPARQALSYLISRPGAGRAGAAPSSQVYQSGLHAALAVGLSCGSAREWQHAVSKLMPALNSCSLLPDPITPTELNHSPHTEPSSAPMPSAAPERMLVRSAHCLLLAMRSLHIIEGSRRVSSDPKASSRRLTIFAGGYAKWLASAVQSVKEPLSAAHLVGISLRASSLAPQCTGAERYFVVELAAQRRLVELSSTSEHALRAFQQEEKLASKRHERCVEALCRSLAPTAAIDHSVSHSSSATPAFPGHDPRFVSVQELFSSRGGRRGA